jgi:hypothetical protein
MRALRRDIDDILDAFESPPGLRRELDRLFSDRSIFPRRRGLARFFAKLKTMFEEDAELLVEDDDAYVLRVQIPRSVDPAMIVGDVHDGQLEVLLPKRSVMRTSRYVAPRVKRPLSVSSSSRS